MTEIAPVAQMDRAPDSESGGHRFESCRERQKNQLVFLTSGISGMASYHFVRVDPQACSVRGVCAGEFDRNDAIGEALRQVRSLGHGDWIVGQDLGERILCIPCPEC
jgi:hypothetical protein